MTTATETSAFPHIDASRQDCITDEQARFFRENGLLKISNLLRGEELKAMQDQTYPLYRRAVEEAPKDPDYLYAKHELTGELVPFRVEFVIDKTSAGKALLGHPFILRSVEKLQGPDFIPTWDSMVFKKEGAGKAIPWHRDSGPYSFDDVDNDVAAFNVDFYLDGSDVTNCLWGILGSNRWPADEAAAKIKKLSDAPGNFSTDEACVRIPTNPGDVLIHNITTLHGSPAAQSKLRRVVYYEFRQLQVEVNHGPHVMEYLPLKQKLLLACQRYRATMPYAHGETPYKYHPGGQFAPPALGANEELPTYRYPHEKFWRK